ncbi:synaptophysin / synaptoporin [Ostertagia ostertagi]
MSVSYDLLSRVFLLLAALCHSIVNTIDLKRNGEHPVSELRPRSWKERERMALLEKGAGWATFVSSVGLCVSTTLLFLYLFRVVDALPQVPWIVGEMCFCFAWTIFFFIAACVLAVAAARFTATGGWAVAAFFAFGAMCAYGFDCYLKFLSWKNNEVATGGGGRDFIAEQRRRAQHV